MDLKKLEAKLLAAGRARSPSQAVPYAFEKRVLALVQAKSVADPWGMWAGALWRATAPCVALTVLLGAWSLFPSSSSTAGDLSQELEMAVLETADLENLGDSNW